MPVVLWLRQTRGRCGKTVLLIGVTLADVYCAKQLSNGTDDSQSRKSKANPITASILIARDRDEIYGFWRDFEQLPKIFDRLDSVRTFGDRRSH